MNRTTNAETMNLADCTPHQNRENVKTVSLTSIGGIIAAFLASLCCIGPVIFAALGVGVGATGVLASTAGYLKALVPYRPLFIVVAIAAIGTGFYLVYRKPKSACVSDTCAPESQARSKSVILLWLATALTFFFVLSPYWLGLLK